MLGTEDALGRSRAIFIIPLQLYLQERFECPCTYLRAYILIKNHQLKIGNSLALFSITSQDHTIGFGTVLQVETISHNYSSAKVISIDHRESTMQSSSWIISYRRPESIPVSRYLIPCHTPQHTRGLTPFFKPSLLPDLPFPCRNHFLQPMKRLPRDITFWQLPVSGRSLYYLCSPFLGRDNPFP